MPMKLLSLWQPHASAIAMGLKSWESRDWATTYRGPVAIHAALKNPVTTSDGAVVRRWEERLGVAVSTLPLGGIVATARIVSCRRAKEVRPTLSAEEMFWGYYGDDRYAWELADIVPVYFLPMRGFPGLIRELSAGELAQLVPVHL